MEVSNLGQKSKKTSARALSLFATRAQHALGLPGEVNIYVTSSREMQDLNRRYRRKNKPTDVLSFPSRAPEVAGDIAISLEIAAANAADIGHSHDQGLGAGGASATPRAEQAGGSGRGGCRSCSGNRAGVHAL